MVPASHRVRDKQPSPRVYITCACTLRFSKGFFLQGQDVLSCRISAQWPILPRRPRGLSVTWGLGQDRSQGANVNNREFTQDKGSKIGPFTSVAITPKKRQNQSQEINLQYYNASFGLVKKKILDFLLYRNTKHNMPQRLFPEDFPNE